MTRLPLTFAAILLSAGLLALACLPGAAIIGDRLLTCLPSDATLGRHATPDLFVDVNKMVATSEPHGSDPPPAPPWTLYASWAFEELREACAAGNWRECRACLRRAWWDAEAAWGAYQGEEVCW